MPACLVLLRVPVLHWKRLKLELWRDESSSPFLRAEVRRITADVMVYDDASGSVDLQVTLATASIVSYQYGDRVTGGVAVQKQRYANTSCGDAAVSLSKYAWVALPTLLYCNDRVFWRGFSRDRFLTDSFGKTKTKTDDYGIGHTMIEQPGLR